MKNQTSTVTVSTTGINTTSPATSLLFRMVRMGVILPVSLCHNLVRDIEISVYVLDIFIFLEKLYEFQHLLCSPFLKKDIIFRKHCCFCKGNGQICSFKSVLYLDEVFG